MIRTLVMIAVAGFVLSAVCISAAIGLAGPEILERGAWAWSGGSWDWKWRHGHFAMRQEEPEATRTLSWSGGETLRVDVPADVRFTQRAGPAELIVTGPGDIVDGLVVEDGTIRSRRSAHHFHMGLYDDRLNIVVNAPRVTRFEAHGADRIDILDYAQDRLELRISGDAAVTAQGRAGTVDLAISGAGDADLSRLAADGADIKVSGSGSAKAGPKTWAKVYISGAGAVTLLSRPRDLETHVSGSGRIEQSDEVEPADVDEDPASAI